MDQFLISTIFILNFSTLQLTGCVPCQFKKNLHYKVKSSQKLLKYDKKMFMLVQDYEDEEDESEIQTCTKISANIKNLLNYSSKFHSLC